MPWQITLKEDYSGTGERRGSTTFSASTLPHEFSIEIWDKGELCWRTSSAYPDRQIVRAGIQAIR
jgi:hypothetical protein